MVAAIGVFVSCERWRHDTRGSLVVDKLELLGHFLRDVGWLLAGLGVLLAGLGVLAFLSPEERKKRKA